MQSTFLWRWSRVRLWAVVVARAIAWFYEWVDPARTLWIPLGRRSLAGTAARLASAAPALAQPWARRLLPDPHGLQRAAGDRAFDHGARLRRYGSGSGPSPVLLPWPCTRSPPSQSSIQSKWRASPKVPWKQSEPLVRTACRTWSMESYRRSFRPISLSPCTAGISMFACRRSSASSEVAASAFILQQNIGIGDYRAAAAQILAIAIVVASMDWLSSKIRAHYV